MTGEVRLTTVVLALDWNGTVVDDTERAYASVRAAIGPEPGPPVDLDTFRDGFHLPLPSWFASLGVPLERVAAIEGRWNEEMCRRPAGLSRGAEQLLTWCRAHLLPVRVVTGASTRLVEADAARLGVRDLIDEIVSVHPKSAELTRWRHDGQRVVFVGDTEYDLTEAHLAGAEAVGFAGGYGREARLRQCRPAALVDDLADVIPLLAAGAVPDPDG